MTRFSDIIREHASAPLPQAAETAARLIQYEVMTRMIVPVVLLIVAVVAVALFARGARRGSMGSEIGVIFSALLGVVAAIPTIAWTLSPTYWAVITDPKIALAWKAGSTIKRGFGL